MTERVLAYNYVRRILSALTIETPDAIADIRQAFLSELLRGAVSLIGLTKKEPVLSNDIVSSLSPSHASSRKIEELCPDWCDPPSEILCDPTLIGWCFQNFNQPLRDESSWAISRSSENQAESVRIGVVTQLFTDEYIADFLVDRCLSLVYERPEFTGRAPVLCDPACGVGHILLAAIRRTGKRQEDLSGLRGALWGFDIDPSAVLLARALVFLQMVISGYDGDLWKLWQSVQGTIVCLDSPFGALDRSVFQSGAPHAFDIVVTNPPYLGRRKLPLMMRAFLDREYPATKVDLCAAFMQRCIELTAQGGAIGLLTSDKWIRLQGYEPLRNGSADFRGILSELSIDIVCELGTGAFHPTTALHDGVKAAILCAKREPPPTEHRLTWARLDKCDSYEKKAAALSALKRQPIAKEYGSIFRQQKWLIHGASEMLLELSGLPSSLARSQVKVDRYADVVVGIQTNADERYVRYVWQVPPASTGWRIHSKGGGYARWGGLNRWVIDWDSGVGEFFKTAEARSKAEAWAERQGWCYTWFANGALGVRPKHAGWSFGRAAASGVFCADERIVAFLNSRLASMASRATGGKIQLPEGVVRALPAPESLEHVLLETIACARSLKADLVRGDIADALFDPTHDIDGSESLAQQALLLVVEGLLEHQVECSLSMTIGDSLALSELAGPVVSSFALSDNISAHALWDFIPERYHTLSAIFDQGQEQPRLPVLTSERASSDSVRSALLERSSSYKRAYLLPSTSVVEHVSRVCEMHPFDAAIACIRLAERDKDVCSALYLSGLCTTVMKELLIALGHRWWTAEYQSPPLITDALDMQAVCAVVAQISAMLGLEMLVGDSPDKWVRRVLLPWQEKKFLKASPIQVEQQGTKEIGLRHNWW